MRGGRWYRVAVCSAGLEASGWRSQHGKEQHRKTAGSGKPQEITAVMMLTTFSE